MRTRRNLLDYNEARTEHPDRLRSLSARPGVVAVRAEADKVWVMHDAPWVRLYLDELCNFPKSEFTDQVDRTTQFINCAKGSPGWSK